MASLFRFVYVYVFFVVLSTAVYSATFKTTNIKAPFIEQFLDISKWKTSMVSKIISVDDVDEEGNPQQIQKTELKFSGNWSVEEPIIFPTIEGDKGLVVLSPSKHHAISALFDEPIDPKNKPFVLQYEVKFQNKLDCGGAYLKILTKQSTPIDQTQLDDKSPYTIMFGPDKCGSQSKIHFIFRHKNPKTGVYEEKHFKNAPTVTMSKLTNLYTLVVEPSNDFAIYENQKKVASGNLLTDFDPPVNPPKEIEDPNDKKPSTWVDQENIPDPKAVKPADWNESEPMFVDDEDAVMPEGWLVKESLYIPDPKSVKPENWNEDDDGPWEPAQIRNPLCINAPGCGPWKRPTKKNPKYQGKWTAPLIPNPAYKGAWTPRKIKNPEYFEDNHPHNFEPMAGILIDIWTVNDKIMFDNIFIGHSKKLADEFASETWAVKYPAEKALEDAADEKEEEQMKENFENEPGFFASIYTSFYSHMQQLIEDLKEDPIAGAQKNAPLLFTFVVAIFMSLFLFSKAFGSSKKASSTPSSDALAAKRKKLELAADDKKKSIQRDDNSLSKDPVTPSRSSVSNKDE